MNEPVEQTIVKSPVMRWSLIALGCFSLSLGILGIFLPLLPTTIFLIIAAACFVRSSASMYDWLHQHPQFGVYLAAYAKGQGMPRRAKAITIGLLWLSLATSAYIMATPWLNWVLLTVGACVTVYLLRLPTMMVPPNEPKP
ncbi:MAG: YbaN family protein [Gammaproteobacteria bacterium]|nr:YbaN family protein [Gammaproteobacteria bacterium]NVK88768.1 YbaN family protein [Gammaproteobacteria bacterium]